MDFSERLKQVRLKLNLSQEELAKELDVAFSTVNRWENKRFKPNYDAIRKFDELLKAKKIKIDE